MSFIYNFQSILSSLSGLWCSYALIHESRAASSPLRYIALSGLVGLSNVQHYLGPFGKRERALYFCFLALFKICRPFVELGLIAIFVLAIFFSIRTFVRRVRATLRDTTTQSPTISGKQLSC